MNSRVVTKQMLIDLDISLGAINNSPLIAQLEQDRNASGDTKPKECRAEAERVIRALRKISPDATRGKGNIDLSEEKPTDYWLGVIWALADLQWQSVRQLLENGHKVAIGTQRMDSKRLGTRITLTTTTQSAFGRSLSLRKNLGIAWLIPVLTYQRYPTLLQAP